MLLSLRYIGYDEVDKNSSPEAGAFGTERLHETIMKERKHLKATAGL